MKEIATSLVLILSKIFIHQLTPSMILTDMQKRLSLLSLALTAPLGLASIATVGCGGGAKTSAADSTATANASGLTGAGSTFINPIMTHWAAEYQTATGIAVNYQSVG